MFLKIIPMIPVQTTKSNFLIVTCYLFADSSCRFEHLGDVVLGLTVTKLLMEMFPGLRVGPATVHLPLHFFSKNVRAELLFVENKGNGCWKSYIG